MIPFSKPGKRLRQRLNFFPPKSNAKGDRRHSIVSSHSIQGGIDPYPGPPIALTERASNGSELSLVKGVSGVDASVERLDVAPPLSYDGLSVSGRSVEGNTARSESHVPTISVNIPQEQQGSALGPQSATSSGSAQSMGVSRREKEESMALLIPHLTSQSGSATSAPRPVQTGHTGPAGRIASPTHDGSVAASSPSTRRLLGPLRDTDSGPLVQENLEQDDSPILPPEYDPRWARR